MLAFYCVLLRDQNFAGLVERQLVERDLGVLLERVRLDFEIRVAQEIEEALRIADTGDGMHGLVAKRLERALRSVLQVIDLRDDCVGAEHAGMAPTVSVDDNRIDLLQARWWLAKRPGRQTQAVAHSARAVDDGDLERAREPVMLQPVVRQYDVDALVLDQRLDASDSIGPGDDRTPRTSCEQHGLVADFFWIAVGADGGRP